MTEVLLEARLTAAFATNGCKCCLRCNVDMLRWSWQINFCILLLIPFLPNNQQLDFLVIIKAATFIHWRFNPETRWWAFLLRCEIPHQDLPVCVIVRGIFNLTCHFLQVIYPKMFSLHIHHSQDKQHASWKFWAFQWSSSISLISIRMSLQFGIPGPVPTSRQIVPLARLLARLPGIPTLQGLGLEMSSRYRSSCSNVN